MLLSELAPYPQWVVRRGDKLPLNAKTGLLASVSDSTTWCDYATAIACCNLDNTLGLGFVLTLADPFSVIDLDDCSGDGDLLNTHRLIVEAFNTYSEVSPSGKGLHIWCKGSVPGGKKDSKRKIELYSSNRYFTVTFNPYQNIAVAERQDLLMMLWKDLGGIENDNLAQNNSAVDSNNDSKPMSEIPANEPVLNDSELCRQCAGGSNGNGELFVELFEGNWKDKFPSQSEADLALCNIVAFYTNDKEQVGRIYYSSKLFMQSPKRGRKAKRDYLFHEKWGLITKAFDQKGPELPPNVLAAIQASNPLKKGEPNVSKTNADNWTSDIDLGSNVNDSELEPLPPTDWQPAPGLMGMVAEFVYNNAVNPVKEVAVAASIAYLAGIAGRGYNISSTGLNHYVILLANTSGGKEGAAQGMDKLTHAVREQVPAFERFIGPSDIASPQGLIKQLVETPCFLSHKGEFGFWLQKLTSKYAKSNETSMRAMLLDLFTKSGYKQTLRGSVYSDRAKNVPNVDSPAFSMFGDSTQQEFYKAIDEVSISEGLIPRFTIIESSDIRPQYNERHNQAKPSSELVYKLGALAKRCLELEMLKTPIDIAQTPEAIKFNNAYREECTDRIYADRSNPIVQVWTRAHLRLLRLGGLVAVGCDPDKPVMTLEHSQWAHGVIEHGCNAIVKRFEEGKVGEVNLLLEQRVLIAKTIYKFCRTTYSEKWYKAYGISFEMFNQKVITHRFIMANTARHSCFRNDKNPPVAMRNVIQELLDSGNLSKVDMAKVKNSGRSGLAYYVLDLRGL